MSKQLSPDISFQWSFTLFSICPHLSCVEPIDNKLTFLSFFVGMLAYAPTHYETLEPWTQRMVLNLRQDYMPHCLNFYLKYESTANMQVNKELSSV